jgi:hypothetical protein
MNQIIGQLSFMALLLAGCTLSPISPAATMTVTPQPTPTKTLAPSTPTPLSPIPTPIPAPEIRPGEIVQDPKFVLEGARLVNTEETWKRIIDCFITINTAKEKPLIMRLAEEAGTTIDNMNMELMYDYFRKGVFDLGDNDLVYMRVESNTHLFAKRYENVKVDLSQINISVVEGLDEYALWKNNYPKNGPWGLIEMDDDNGFYADESNWLVLGGLVPYKDQENVLKFTLVVRYVRPGNGSKKFFPGKGQVLTSKHLEALNNIFSAHMYSYILVSSTDKQGFIKNDFFDKSRSGIGGWGGNKDGIGAPPGYYKDFSNYVRKYGPLPEMIPDLFQLSN